MQLIGWRVKMNNAKLINIFIPVESSFQAFGLSDAEQIALL